MKREKALLAGSLVLSLALLVTGCGGTASEEGEEGGGIFSSARKAEPLVLPAGTALDVRLTTGLNSKNNRAGDPFHATLEHPVVVGEKVVIPKGADIQGRVTRAVKSGRLKKRAELWVTLTEVTVQGASYDIGTTTTGHKEGSKTKRDVLFIGGGAGAGAAVGGATGGGKGAGIGAAIGAGAGTAAAMLTGQRDIKFPPETLLRFKLEEELRIQP
ncbi:MAG: hypothetical protein ACE5IP_03760 [Terriglobia bacterium]